MAKIFVIYITKSKKALQINKNKEERIRDTKRQSKKIQVVNKYIKIFTFANKINSD